MKFKIEYMFEEILNNKFFYYYLVRDVHVPTRGTTDAAGIDFYVPYYSPEFLNDLILKNKGQHIVYDIDDSKDGNELVITLYPGQRILIPSGVKTMISRGTALIAANKSGVATKKGLRFTAQVVDSDYSGEVHIGVANDSDETIEIRTGEKLIQFVHTPVILSEPKACPTKELFEKFHEDSKRQAKGFGSDIKIEDNNLNNAETVSC